MSVVLGSRQQRGTHPDEGAAMKTLRDVAGVRHAMNDGDSTGWHDSLCGGRIRRPQGMRRCRSHEVLTCFECLAVLDDIKNWTHTTTRFGIDEGETFSIGWNLQPRSK